MEGGAGEHLPEQQQQHQEDDKSGGAPQLSGGPSASTIGDAGGSFSLYCEETLETALADEDTSVPLDNLRIPEDKEEAPNAVAGTEDSAGEILAVHQKQRENDKNGNAATFLDAPSCGRSSPGAPQLSDGRSASTRAGAGGSSSFLYGDVGEILATAPADEEISIPLDSPRTLAAKSKNKKKNGTKAGRGVLLQITMKVCEKLKSKEKTTVIEVADEIVHESVNPSKNTGDHQQHSEKNIRKRVYNVMNVLLAIDIISKDEQTKMIQWKGSLHTGLNDNKKLKEKQIELTRRIKNKTADLQHMKDHFTGYKNLVQRNGQLYESGHGPSAVMRLPFLIVQTSKNANVEIEISEDSQMVHMDFNSFPFKLHDGINVIKKMGFCEREQQQDDTQKPSSN